MRRVLKKKVLKSDRFARTRRISRKDEKGKQDKPQGSQEEVGGGLVMKDPMKELEEDIEDWESRMATSPTVEDVFSQLSHNRQQRNKEEILEEVGKIKDRVERIFKNADDEEDSLLQNKPRGFLLKEKLLRMTQQKVVLDKVMDFIEDCANRLNLLTEVNEWLWKDHKLTHFDSDDDEMEEEVSMTEHIETYVRTQESLTQYEETVARFLELLHQLIKKTGLFQSGGRRATLKLQVYDEGSLLKSNDKWNAAINNVGAIFEDAVKWIKNPTYKNAVRTGFRQYRHLVQAIRKKNASHMQTQKMLADLKKRIETSKSVKEKLEKEASDMQRKMIELTKQVSELKGTEDEAEGSTVMKKKAKDLEDKWKAKEKEVTGLESKINELQDELERIQSSPPQPDVSMYAGHAGRGGPQKGGRGARGKIQGAVSRQGHPGVPYGFQGHPPPYGAPGFAAQHEGHPPTPSDLKPGLPGTHGLAVPQAVLQGSASHQRMVGGQSVMGDHGVMMDQQAYLDGNMDGSMMEQYSRYDLQGSHYNFQVYQEDMVDEEEHEGGMFMGEFGAFSDALKDVREEGGSAMHLSARYMGRVHSTSRMDARAASQVFYGPPNEREAFMAKEKQLADEANSWLAQSAEPPPDADAITYYKNLVAGLKKTLVTQMARNRDPNRWGDASGKLQAPRLPSIQREAAHVLRTMEHFSNRVLQILRRENLHDSAVNLQKFAGIVTPQLSQDPLRILPQVSVKVAEFADGMAQVLSQAFVSMRLRVDIPEVDMGPATHIKAITIQLDDMEQLKRHAMDAFYNMGKVRNHLKGPAIQKLQYEMDMKAQDIIYKDKKQHELRGRIRAIYGMFDKLQAQVEDLNKDFEETVKKKVAEREQLLVTQMRSAKTKRKPFDSSDLFLSCDVIRRNLCILDQAYTEQKLPKHLYSLALQVLQHALDLPDKRFQYLLEKYVYYRKFKNILDDLEDTLSDKDTIDTKRGKLIQYKTNLERRYNFSMESWDAKSHDLKMEKLDIFGSIWQLFNTILMETGLVLLHPLFQEKRQMPELPPLKKMTQMQRWQLVKPFLLLSRDRKGQELPKSLVGAKMPIYGWSRSETQLPKMPNVAPPTKAADNASVTVPAVLHLDVNERRVMAQRTLERLIKKPAPVGVTQGYIVASGKVGYLHDDKK